MIDDFILPGLIVVGAVLIGGVIWASIEEGNACRQAGGHMISKSSPGIGLGSNGQMVTTFNTVSFCISKDGRILE